MEDLVEKFRQMEVLNQKLEEQNRELTKENLQLKEQNQQLREQLKKMQQNVRFPTHMDVTKMETSEVPPDQPKKIKLDPQLGLLLPKFKKRPGTLDFGKEFEVLMYSLYALKLSLNDDVVDFQLISDDERCGLFDDIGFTVTFTDGTRRNYMFQVKHRERSIVITKEHLEGTKRKHLYSLEKYFDSLSEIQNEDATLIVYTNNSVKLQDTVLMNGIEVEICPHLEHEDLLLNTNAKDTVVRFKSLNTGRTIYFFTDQYNVVQVESTLKLFLTEHLKCDIYGSVIHYLRYRWSKNYVLTKHDCVTKLTELALSPFIQVLSNEKANDKTDELKNAIMQFELTVVKTDANIVEKIWALEEDFSRNRKVFALTTHDVLFKSKIAWFMDKVPLVVLVDDRNASLVKSVLKLLKKDLGQKKIVLVGKTLNFEKWDVFRNLKDLIAKVETSNRLFKEFKISLQGRPAISLEQLLSIDQDISQYIGTSELLEMSQKEYCLIGKPKKLPPLYIPRTVLSDGNRVQERDVFDTFKNSVNVFCAPPGMGKSTFLKSLSCHCSPDSWAIYICLINYNFIFTVRDIETIVEKLLELEEHEGLAKQIRKVLLKHRKVEIFLDGLDEVDARFVDTVLECVQRMAQEGLRVWLTSREHLREKIHQTLKVVPMEIQKFTIEDQQAYIRERLKVQYPDEKIEEIFSAVFKSTNISSSQEVLGIPLQLYLITEVFLNSTADESLEKENLFVLPRLYKLFFDGKKSFTFAKLGIDKSLEYQLGINFDRELEQYEIPALKSCLRTSDFQKLSLDERSSDNFIREVARRGDRNGIISSVDNNRVLFVHSSFAEYFASLWLKKHKMQLELLKDTFLSPGYKNLRVIFDSLMAENCPLHLAVIYENETIRKYVRRAEEIDEGGRTALHLACSKDLDTETLDVLLDKCTNIRQRDHLLKFDCVEYSLYSETLYPIERILERRLLDSIHIDIKNKEQLAVKAAQFGYPRLLAAVMKQLDKSTTSGVDLLIKAIKSNSPKSTEVVQTLLEFGVDINEKYHGRTPLDYACLIGRYDVVEVLLDRGALCSDGNTPCHRMMEGQTTESVAEFIRILNNYKIDVNATNENGQTLLHLACRKSFTNIARLLVERGVDLNVSDELGDNALDYAVRWSDNSTRMLIERGVNVNARNKNGQTALHVACMNSRLEVVELLLSYGCDVNSLDSSDENTLHYAVRNQENSSVLQALIQHGVDINARNKDGQTALHLACANSRSEIVKLLLNHGCDVNSLDSCNDSALHYAVRGHEDLSTLQALIERGVDINAQNKNGQTALHLACGNSRAEVVKLLLIHGCDVNSLDNAGDNALHYAARASDDVALVETLIDKEININVPNSKGQTALHLACERSHYEIVKLLIYSCVDVSVVDKAGDNALHYVVRGNEDLSLLKILIGTGVNINGKNDKGQTALHLACEESHKETVKLLTHYDVEVNAVDNAGDNALHYAARSVVNNKEIIDWLVQVGVNVNVQNNNGTTPLQFACEEGNFENVITLLRKGADVNIVDKSGKNAFNYATDSWMHNNEIKTLLINKGVEKLGITDEVMEID